MAELKDEDLRALVEACLDDGMGFGATSKEVRRESEWTRISVRAAVDLTIYGFRLAIRAGHPRASSVLDGWLAIYHHTPQPKVLS